MTYIPSDPLFARQWHLQNNTPGLLDLNVVDVWDDYTGAGVDVAVIDDGLQRSHPDLDGNYSKAKDWDFENNDTNPSGTDGDNHGTSVAGIISANEGNGIGGVGVAYGSNLFGFQTHGFINNRFVRQLTSAIDNASGQQRQSGFNHEADVVNMSLGTIYDQNYFDSSLNNSDMQALNAAISNAATSGRNGLGTILVKSAGNDRALNQDTNASSWNANPRTISVAAVDQDGGVSTYSTHGASLLVSAFGTPRQGQVVTTDRTGNDGYSNGDYTFGFNGTSAAAPMVSGVVALMLEANPYLDWRDVQEILAYSARRVGSDVGRGTSGSEEYTWAFNGANDWNGGGLHFSNDYGFGLVDAKAAVRLSETWGRERKTGFDTLSASVGFGNAPITLHQAGTTLVQDVRVNIEVEHVEVDLSFMQWHDLGDLEMLLISPSGTSSILIQNIGENDGTAADGFGSGRWQFYSNEFRGENSLGDWTLQLFDQDSNITSPITVKDIDVRLMGGIDKLTDNFIFTEEFSKYAGTFGHTKAIDGGRGIDTINAAAVSSKTSINLAARTGTIDGVAVTLTDIENVFTGDGDDSVIGNAADNQLVGMRGNDYLYGFDGDNILKGGKGNDWLVGGKGNDSMYGGLGDDSFTVYSALDKTIELAGEGTDAVYTHVNYTLSDHIENMTLRDSVYHGRGNSLNNIIRGNDSQNLIEGLKGNDRLYGFGGDDVLKGGDGDDDLIGGLGEDKMYGGLGDDEFTVYSTLDEVVEFTNEGVDAIYTHVDYTLPENVENLTLRESVAYGGGNRLNNGILGNNGNNTVQGFGGDDRIYGFDGNDTLEGGEGNDWLVGGAGSDTMNGGLGNDSFTVYSTLDKVIEGANEGTDTVYTHVNYTLFDHVENMTLREAVYHGRGNSSNNTIRGNSSQNLIEGLDGNDNLHGYYGDDVLNGGKGDDYLNGGYDHDELIGGVGNDKLAGNNGDDVLTGGAGDDLLLGGVGADIFIFEKATDGLDLITDFSQIQNDVLKILGSGFGGNLSKGLLDSRQFVLGSTSANADSRFLYNQSTGSLSFDSDGTGNAAATKIATLSNKAELSYSNILIA